MNVTAAVFLIELRQLVRDRRALFTAVLLPALLYPLIFFLTGELEQFSEETLAAREVKVAVDMQLAEPSVAARARTLLESRTPIVLLQVDASELRAIETDTALGDEHRALSVRSAVRELFGGSAHLLLTAEPHATAPRRTLFQLYSDVKDDVGREAVARAESALAELEDGLVRARRAELLGRDPSLGLDLEFVDIASAEDTIAATLGRLLPFIAVLVLLSGGAYAALAVFAGERESGTLETLLVQPISRHPIAWGKYLAVLTAGLVTLTCNVLSIVASVALGIGSFAESEVEVRGVELLRLAGGVVYLPGCVLLTAVLCLVCGRARTFREGQQTLLPISLLAALPSAVVLAPDLEFGVMWAVIPFAGPALAMRDAFQLELALLPFLAMLLSHGAYSWLALSRIASILDAEKLLGTADTEAEAVQRHAHSRRALRWGFISVLCVYVVGGRLQAWNPTYGLAITLWLILPVLAFLCARGTARRLGVPWYTEFGLRPPALRYVLGALLLIPGLVWLASIYLPLQERLLPFPESMAEAPVPEFLLGMSSWKLFFLIAITPGICEELLFRGALLSSMRKDMRPAAILGWQALLFAAAHASVYRLLPTAVLGALFAALTLRSKSVVPVMLVHAGYNGLLVLGQLERLPWIESPWFDRLCWLSLVGVALFALPRRGVARTDWV